MTLLMLSSILFVGGHLALSSLPVRGWLVAKLSEKLFIPFYSAISFLALGGMILGLKEAQEILLWQTADWMRWLALLSMPFALILIVAGASSKNPTAVYQGEALRSAHPAPGILTVTRHPVMWGVLIWALAHMIANGTMAELIFFAAFALLALLGTLHQEAKRRATQPEAWARFAAVTSHVPLLAILEKRIKADWQGIGPWRVLAALSVYAALLLLHPWLFGQSPL